MSKHTPGPWIPSASRVSTRNDERICWIAPLVGHDVCGDREIANAHLIAASPELLACLRRYVAWQQGNFDAIDIEMEILHPAQAAIAKAEGMHV